MSTTQPSTPALDRLSTICAQMTKSLNEFRRGVQEAKVEHQRQIEKLQQERDAALLMVERLNENINSDPNGIGGGAGGGGGMDAHPAKKVQVSGVDF